MLETEGKTARGATEVAIREALPGDAPAAGQIAYDSFRVFQEGRGFTADFPSAEAATRLIAGLIADPLVYAVVATVGDKVVGSNFLMEGDIIRGIGPISV